MSKVLKIEAEKSPYNPNYFAIKVKCEDGVNLRDVLEALKNYRKQENIKKAFASVGVMVLLKLAGAYIPGGNVPEKMYKDYLNAK